MGIVRVGIIRVGIVLVPEKCLLKYNPVGLLVTVVHCSDSSNCQMAQYDWPSE